MRARLVRNQAAVAFTLAVATAVSPAAAEPAAAGKTPVQARPLYVTNSALNTAEEPNVAVFAIGASGLPAPVGDPVPTGPGARTRGIVFTPDARVGYVVNGGANTVAAYRVGDRGGLAAIGDPVDTGGRGPFGIAITPDGQTVYTANETTGTVSVLRARPTGQLELRGEPVDSGADNPKGVAVSPDGRFLFVSHGSADDIRDVLTTFAIGPHGALTPRGAVKIGASGAGVGVTPDGRFLYVANQDSEDVHGFRIGRSGKLTPVPGGPSGASDFAEGVAVAPDGRHLYVAAPATRKPETDDGVWVYRIGSSGRLTPLADEQVPAGDGSVGITVTPDGRHLYTGNFRDHNVSAFDVLDSGGLAELAGSPVPSQGASPAFQAVAVLPNQGPTARFAVAVHPAGQLTRFDASSSSDQDGHVARYDWDFGDGTTLTDGGPTPTHVYRHPGTFRVRLTVVDNERCSVTFVYTGQTPLCNGTPAAQTTRELVTP